MRIAAYARYSSEMQHAASIDDQLRNVRRYCAQQGWSAPRVYEDRAISGARADRPGYVACLAAGMAGEYDVLVVDDLSRLSRDSIETARAIKHLKFTGVRVIGVSDGVDTQREGYKIEVGLRGLMSELYLDDLRKKTHRGLTGRALKGASAGGLPYGYRVTTRGQREIDEAKAEIVRRIYRDFAAGQAPRAIAAALNAEGVPSGRDSTWVGTAIYGDTRRGIGILANPIYVGRQIWNRSRWVKHPDTGRRQRVERPESEWIITEHPDLRIIDADLWRATRDRIEIMHRRTAVQRGRNRRSGGGRYPRHMLSGILRCGECGGPFVIVDAYRYGCAAHKDRGHAVCSNATAIPYKTAEAALLRTVKEDCLGEEAFRVFERAARDELKTGAPDTAAIKARIAGAERERDNIMAAIRAGIITPSTKTALQAAEKSLAEAVREEEIARTFQPSQILPRAKETWQRWVATLEDHRDAAGVRAAVQEILGPSLTVETDGDAVYASVHDQIIMVAGARYVRCLHRIRLR